MEFAVTFSQRAMVSRGGAIAAGSLWRSRGGERSRAAALASIHAANARKMQKIRQA
jgi:hypothetical protein